jgi:hypothetical protein
MTFLANGRSVALYFGWPPFLKQSSKVTFKESDGCPFSLGDSSLLSSLLSSTTPFLRFYYELVKYKNSPPNPRDLFWIVEASISRYHSTSLPSSQKADSVSQYMTFLANGRPVALYFGQLPFLKQSSKAIFEER